MRYGVPRRRRHDNRHVNPMGRKTDFFLFFLNDRHSAVCPRSLRARCRALVVKRKNQIDSAKLRATAVLYFLSFRENPTVLLFFLFFFNNISSSRVPRHHESADLLHTRFRIRSGRRLLSPARSIFPRHATKTESIALLFASTKSYDESFVSGRLISAVIPRSRSSKTLLAYHSTRGFIFNEHSSYRILHV